MRESGIYMLVVVSTGVKEPEKKSSPKGAIRKDHFENVAGDILKVNPSCLNSFRRVSRRGVVLLDSIRAIEYR